MIYLNVIHKTCKLHAITFRLITLTRYTYKISITFFQAILQDCVSLYN